MTALGALLLADADRLVRTASVAAAMSRRGAARAPTSRSPRPTSSPGRIRARSRSPAELRHLLRDSGSRRPTTRRRTRSRTRTRCAACRRSTARSATRSTTCGACSTSRSTPPPTTRSSSRRAASCRWTRSRPAAGSSSPAATSTASRSPSRSTSRSSRIAELGSISERRTALLLDPRLNGGLPAFLARTPGLNSGLMILQYTAAALASENKVLAHPASADSIPTSANQEDHVSMGADRGAPRARRSSGTSSRSWRSSCCARRRPSTCGSRDGCRRAAARPGAGVARRTTGSASGSRHLDDDREPGPDLAAAIDAGPDRARSRTLVAP